MYTLTNAIRKLLALDTLNEDREQVSYHLQEVNFSMVQEPLVVNNEVKEEQSELPFWFISLGLGGEANPLILQCPMQKQHMSFLHNHI